MQENQPETEEYYRCRTCGEYSLKKEAVRDVFCSNFCATKFTKCENCGKYFTKLYKTDDNYCSDACRQKYNDYIKIIEQNMKSTGEFL